MKFTSTGVEQDYRTGTFVGDEFYYVSLAHVTFLRGNFRDATFTCCDLRHARFEGCDLRHVRFNNCDMLGAQFAECDLKDARFESCDMGGANFQKSDLTGTDFDVQSLRDVAFEGAKGIAQVYVPNVSSRNASLTAIMGSDGKVILQTGCFKGSIEEFSTELSIQKRGGGIYEETAMLLCRGLQELISQ